MTLVASGCGGRSALDTSYEVAFSTTGGRADTSATLLLGGTSTLAGGTNSVGGQAMGGFPITATGGQSGKGGAAEFGGEWAVGGTSSGGTSSSDTDSGRLRAGLTAWTHTGWPRLDNTGNLFTEGGGYMGTARSLWMLDRATGAELWSLAFYGNICETRSAFVAFAATTLSGFSLSNGAPLWSVNSDSTESQLCAERSDLFFTTEEATYGWTLNAYSSVDGSRLWQTVLAAKSALEHMMGETLYVSWSTNGQTNLRAINAQDGTTLWTGGFAASQPIQFLFDAQEHVFALDTSEGQDFLGRVNTADGTLVWEYRAESPTLDFVLENSSSYILVRQANQLTALDKATGEWLWSYDEGFAATDGSNQVHFTALSDILLVRRDAEQVSTTALGQNGVARWTIATQVTDLETGDLYTLYDNALSRLDRYTGEPVWTYAFTLPASGTYELLGGHGDAVFLAGPSVGGWAPPPVRTVTALSRSDGHLLWQSAEQVAGSLMAADEERLYLWSGATAKYDTYGVTTAIWFGSR